MTLCKPRWVMGLAMVLALALSGDALAAKKVLRIKLDGPVAESPGNDNPLAMLMAGQKPPTLYGLIQEIEKAGKDADIGGIILVLDQPQVGLAHVEELTRALKSFRSAGKKVLCYTDHASNSSYAMACAADFVMLAENSELDIVGLHAEMEYYKGLLDKLGLEMEMLHCGAFKSALEPFVRTEPSKEAAENINWLLDGIYNRWVTLLADGRNQTPEQIKSAIDTAPLLVEEALKRKLIDSTGSWEDFSKLVKKEFGDDAEVVKKLADEDELEIEVDPSNPFAVFQQMQTVMEKLFGPKEDDGKPAIGLIYLEGAITTGKSEPGMFGGGNAGSTTLRAAIDKAADDSDIKAVVLRVNSPGGSALASDIIWKAATRLAKAKPLIVSMGAVAGSGGYYVSISGDTIFAEECTITASIGVVGGKMCWKGLWEDKLGITTTEYSRGANADIMASTRKWSDGERSKMQAYMDTVYGQFKGRIKSSRGDRIKGELDDMAGGRVFTGKQALERGLIDRLGGLNDAIHCAAEKAKLKDYRVAVLPKEKDFGELLKMLMGQPIEDEYEVALPRLGRAAGLVGEMLPVIEQLSPGKSASLIRFLTQLSIIERERVTCWMPLEVRIK